MDLPGQPGGEERGQIRPLAPLHLPPPGARGHPVLNVSDRRLQGLPGPPGDGEGPNLQLERAGENEQEE